MKHIYKYFCLLIAVFHYSSAVYAQTLTSRITATAPQYSYGVDTLVKDCDKNISFTVNHTSTVYRAMKLYLATTSSSAVLNDLIRTTATINTGAGTTFNPSYSVTGDFSSTNPPMNGLNATAVSNAGNYDIYLTRLAITAATLNTYDLSNVTSTSPLMASGSFNNPQRITILPSGLCSAPTSASSSNNITLGSGPQTSNLNASGATLGTGGKYKWYTGGCGVSLVGTGSSISVSPTTTTTYYVRAESPCDATSCLQVTVTVSCTNPSTPNGVSATAISSSQINLSWNSVSGATGYDIYSCSGSLLASNVSGTSYSFTGLSASTSYSYYVVALGSGTCISANSSCASATTQSSCTPPATPTGLNATAVSSSQINLSWNAVSGANGYYIYSCAGTLIDSTISTSYSHTGLAAGTIYNYKIVAKTSVTCVSTFTTCANDTTLCPTLATPTGLTATGVSLTQINLSWNAVTNATSYDIYTCTGVFIANTSTTSYSVNGLNQNTIYSYYIIAKYNALCYSSIPSCASDTTLPCVPPATPTGLIATGISSSQIVLSWTAVSGATNYDIYTCANTYIATTTTTSYTINGLTPNTIYSYKIRAKISDSCFSATTSCASDTTLIYTPVCKTPQISLNTGRNPDGSLIAIGSQDTMWKITSVTGNVSIPAGQSIPYSPFAVNLCTPSCWFIPTNSRYINYFNGNNESAGPLNTEVEMTRHFITNKDDSFLIKTFFSADNYVAYFKIDNINYFTSSSFSNSNNYSIQNLAINDQRIFLKAGCHDITVKYGNWYNGTTSTNLIGLNIEGYIKSTTLDSSIVADYCRTNTPPSISGTDTVSHCKGKSYIAPNFTITATNSCANLSQVKVYFTSGYNSSKDSLSMDSTAGFTKSFNATTGVLTITGNANYDVWQTLLRKLWYQSKSTYYTTSTKKLSIVLGDLPYNHSNGHFYKLISNGVGNNLTWTDSKNAASASSYMGMQGYLVTITDSIENDLVTKLALTNGTDHMIWIGANDANSEGIWRWVTGCEGLESSGLGRHFCTNTNTSCGNTPSITTISGRFHNWVYYDPNNSFCSENWAALSPGSWYGKWFDAFHNQGIYKYVIEYGCMPNDLVVNLVGNVVLHIKPTDTFTITKTICYDTTFLGRNATGVYRDTFTNQYGCDSIRTLNLTVSDCISLTYSDTQSYCKGNQNISTNLTIQGKPTATINGAKVYFENYSATDDTLLISTLTPVTAVFNASTGVLSLSGAATKGRYDTILKSIVYRKKTASYSQSTKKIKITIGDALYNPTNGHYYKLVNHGSAITWTNARNAASASTHFGLQGYLVTVTDSNENNFLTTLIQSYTWIGASDANLEGTWRWVTGCEGLESGGLGRHFSSQNKTGTCMASPVSVISSNYNNWVNGGTNASEPNDCGCWPGNHCEDYAHLNAPPNKTWNDFPNNANVLSYIIEYGCMPSDPVVNLVGSVLLKINPMDTTSLSHTMCIGNIFLGRTSTGIYKDTLINRYSCDSIRTLNLTVKDTSHRDSFRTICKNHFVLFKGSPKNSTGIYRDTLTNSQGCDSFFYLHLTVNDTSTKILFDTTCRNYPKLFNGANLNLSGLYRDTLVNSVGCDSFIYYNLFVKDTTKKDSFLTICKNQPVIFNGISRNSTGIYKDTLVNTQGCDSFMYLHLTVLDTTKKDSFLTICKNQPVVFNGISRNVTGIYKDTLVNTQGCDSFMYLHLTVKDTTKKDSFLSICRNKPVVFNGVSLNTAGTYKDTLVNAVGCDSFIYLHLTIRDTSFKILYDTTCRNYPKLFNGANLNLSGLYRDTLVNAVGCDSFIYYNLFVKDTTKKDSFLTICKNQPVIFNGISRNNTGIYKDTLVNTQGCDSFIYLHLTVKDTTKKDSFLTICKNQPVVFNGISRNITGIYKDTLVNAVGCDSFMYLHLTVKDTTKKDSFLSICRNKPVVFNGWTLNTAGTYKDTSVNLVGCDSFIYLHLTIRDTSFKVLYDTTCRNFPKFFNGSNLNISALYRDTLFNALGCDSFIYYNLFVKDTTKKDSFLTICKNQPVVFNGISRNVTGIDKDTLVNTQGCDSFIYLHLTVLDTTKKDSFLTICRNQPVIFNGISRNVTGIYKDTLVNAVGCDSFMYLHLTVKDTTKKDSFLSICRNKPVVFNGWTLNTAGTYKDTLVNAVGCDSFVYLHLSIRDTNFKILYDTTCRNYPKLFNGANLNISGLYRDTLVNALGCDSFIYYYLFVKDTTKKDSFLTICKNQPVIFNGISRNNTGIYKDTLVNTQGCDSFMYLHLTVITPYTVSRDTDICYSYTHRGILYKSNSTVFDTLKNIHGCDSLYKQTNLLIHNPITVADDSAKGCKKVEYRGELYKKDTSFQINQSKIIFPYCDSIIQKAVVRVYPLPKAKLVVTPDTVVKEGEQVDVKATGGLKYRWNLTSSTSSLIEYTITETTIFQVTVTDHNQCDTTLIQTVDLISTIDVPEVFSPNQDGNNDNLIVTKEGNIIITGFKIYNRWGQVVFETNDQNPRWDGKFKGDDQPQGSYVYQIEYLVKGKKSFKTGATTLIR